MKVSTKDLLKLFKIQVGQKIKVGKAIMTVTENGLLYNDETLPITTLLGVDYEIIQELGQITCENIECYNCPLRFFECGYGSQYTLKEKVDFLEKDGLDSRIVKLLREALNNVSKTSK